MVIICEKKPRISRIDSDFLNTETRRMTLAVGRWPLAVGGWSLAVGRWRFWRICNISNPPALIIGICNADKYRVLYSLSESYRIINPDIKHGRITNPPERAKPRISRIDSDFLNTEIRRYRELYDNYMVIIC